jgi:hypothetical protein
VFKSLKRQNRVRVTGQRRTVSAAPIKSGRGEASIASSDEGEIEAIARATRRRAPIYFIRNNIGATLDVLTDKPKALRTRDEMRERHHNGRSDINVYERLATTLVKL